MWTPNQTKHMKRNNLHRAQISVTIHEVIVTIILILIITFKIILQSLGKSLEGHIFCYCESGFCGVQNLIGGKQILSKFSVTHIRTKNINFTVLITNTFNIYILHLTTQNVVCPQHYFQQFFPHLSFLLVHTALSCFSAGS